MSMSWINEKGRDKTLYKEAISPFLRGALTNQYHPLNRTTEVIAEQLWPIQMSGPRERFRISSFKMHLVGSILSFQRTTVPSRLTWDRNVINSNLTQMLWTHKSSFIFSKSWMWSTPQFSWRKSMTLQPSWQSCTETRAALDHGKIVVGLSICGHG